MMRTRWLIASLLSLALLPSGVWAQQTGSITGRVTSADAQAPLAGVQVTVVGTTRGAVTDQQGRFTIGSVPSGPQRVRAGLLGYAEQEQRATVSAGSTATVNFQLTASALQVSGVVVTATGREQRQREIGSAVGVVDPARVEMAAVTSTAQLLQGRVPGAVVMQSSGTTGSGARVRIRGNNSMSLSNAPLLIVDGVRVESAESSLGFGVGGQAPSRLNDINPEDIESIEILKGPAAAALYGTAAANGVIQIATKRGKAGAPRFRVWSEYGRLDQTTTFPVNTWAVGQTVTATNRNRGLDRCDLVRLAIGANPTGTQVGCTGITQTYTHSPLTDPATDPFNDGNRSVTGASVSGGSDAATYYVSSDFERENGVLPDNHLRRVRVQANTTGRVGSKLNIGTNIAYLDNRTQLPQSDNASFGILPMGLYGNPQPSFIESQQGFQSDPQFHYDWKTFQNYSRIMGAVRGDYRPLSWLTANGTVGLDRYAREEVNRLPRNNAYGIFGSVYTHGFIQDYTYDIWDLTSNGSLTANFNLGSDLVATSSVGTSYIRERLHRIYAFGADLTPGVETSLAGASSDFEADEANTLNATLSAYGQQQFAWRDRVFINAALRGDQNTAFGTNIGWVWYPSLSGSWVITEEPFFPDFAVLDNFRIRAAYGQSGLRPGPEDALQAYGSAVTTASSTAGLVDAPAIIFNLIGNPDLKPERATEYEFGFESGWLDNRLGLEFTYFDKHSINALVSKPLPPSIGSSSSRYENLGRVDNSGVEAAVRAQLVRRRNLSWDVNLSGSRIHNELVEIGKDARGQDIPDVVFGFNALPQRHREGFPLGSYFHFPIESYSDLDGNGLLSPNEVVVRRDTTVYLGNPFPTREVSFNTDLRLGDWVKFSTLLDYKGGHRLFNFTAANRCDLSVSNCADLYNPSLPLDRQAAIVAMRSYASMAGFVEKADFVKLRELSLTFGLPREFAERFSASGLSLTLAGRNLKTWTDYTGLDPEVNSQGQANFTTVELGTLPPNRLFTIRIDANF